MANRLRDAAKERRWREALERFAGSGLSVRAFCRRERFSEASFYAWRRTLAQRDDAARRAAPVPRRPRAPAPAGWRQPAFLPLRVRNGAAEPAPCNSVVTAQPAPCNSVVTAQPALHDRRITLELIGGRALRLPDLISTAWLAELVVALEARTSG